MEIVVFYYVSLPPKSRRAQNFRSFFVFMEISISCKQQNGIKIKQKKNKTKQCNLLRVSSIKISINGWKYPFQINRQSESNTDNIFGGGGCNINKVSYSHLSSWTNEQEITCFVVCTQTYFDTTHTKWNEPSAIWWASIMISFDSVAYS